MHLQTSKLDHLLTEKCPLHTILDPFCILSVKQYNLIDVFLTSIEERSVGFDSPWHKIVACSECF